MEKYPFIFSNRRRYRLLRHFVFWFCWWSFCTFLYAYTPYYNLIPEIERFPVTATESACFLVLHMFLSYSLIYGVVPFLLLKGKYLATFISVVSLIVATGLLNALLTKYFLNDVRDFVLSYFSIDSYDAKKTQYYSFHLAILAGLRGGITIGGMAAAIKLMKYWYAKEQRNLQLQKENATIHLQLLKAQVHPHFLFNTLNNIYSFTQVKAPDAAKMVTGLSDILRYMLYDGNNASVPLDKELHMLEQYIRLEQTRYANLEVHINVTQGADRLAIAPLLLFPLVENCFKHGASAMLEQPWINLYVTFHHQKMNFKLMNGKPPGNKVSNRTSGIGIGNVRKRLDLLYPDKHQLKITDEEDVFVVDLQIELNEIAMDASSKKKELVYA